MAGHHLTLEAARKDLPLTPLGSLVLLTPWFQMSGLQNCREKKFLLSEVSSLCCVVDSSCKELIQRKSKYEQGCVS